MKKLTKIVQDKKLKRYSFAEDVAEEIEKNASDVRNCTTENQAVKIKKGLSLRKLIKIF